MNEKAIELGLQNTSFADPSGLNANNVSSAFDLSHLITFAASDERIASIMRTPTYTVTTNRRMIPIHSTNHLLHVRRRRSDGRQDRLHQQVGLLPGDAAAPARRATRSPWSSSARARTTAASGRRAISSAGSKTKAAELFKDQAPKISSQLPVQLPA